MNFSKAKILLDEGKMVRRSEWFFADTFVFRQVPSVIPKEVVPKMQSLPDLVKQEFQRRFDSPSMQVSGISYSNQYALVNGSNLIVGYSPSVSDIQAEDWMEYKPE